MPEKDDLEQFAVRRFQIGEQSDFLQSRPGHAVCLVNDHDNPPTFGIALHQNLLKTRQDFGAIPDRRVGHEIARDGVQDFVAIEHRVGQIDGVGWVRLETLEQHAAEHGFAHADFAHHGHDAFVVHGRHQQPFEDVTPLATTEEKLGIGGDPKGIGLELEMVQVQHAHGRISRWAERGARPGLCILGRRRTVNKAVA